MAIAVTSNTTLSTGSGNVTLSAFSVSGRNPIIVVVTASRDAGITSISRDGQSFTQAITKTETVYSQGVSQIWYLASPNSGSSDITIVYEGGVYCAAMGILINDAAQTSPIDATGSANGGGTVITPTNVTTIDNDLIIQGWAGRSSSGPPTATWGSSQTELGKISSSSALSAAVASLAAGASGSKTLNVTPVGSSVGAASTSISIKQLLGAAGGTLTLMGV